MGIYNQDNLRGYGRIVPVKDIDVAKLLFANRNKIWNFVLMNILIRIEKPNRLQVIYML